MKRLKRIVAAVLTVALIGTACVGVTAQAPSFKYVGLGDSIAEGYGVGVEKSHVNIIGENLKAIGTEKGYDVVYYNQAKSGDTSQDLLNKVNSHAFADTLTNADIVTISIGGNDIMQFLAREGAIALGLNPNDGDVIEKMISAVTADPQGAIKKVMAHLQTEEFGINRQAMLDKCMANLKSTISKIKELAPNSKIYVMTIYDVINDYRSGAKEVTDSTIKFALLLAGNMLNSLVMNPINQLYKDNAADLYTVADVFTTYKEDTSKQSLLFLDFLAPTPVIDPHPTVYGQQVIAGCFEKAFGEVFTETIIELGNVRGNGITVVSALLTLQHSVELITLEGNDYTAADVDLDKDVTIKDALQILQYSVGLIDEFIPASNMQ